ncbi:phosphatase PAP2 family protein [Patescibacteria group bacterium]|nr:phosphatase PAP2 family protein [Patescibacteria group bacterium]
MDLYLFNLLNQYALKWNWLDFLAVFFAEYLGYFLVIWIIVLAILNFKKYFKMVLESIFAGILARFGIAELIRLFWERPRPFIDNSVNLLFEHNGPAFPSGHASFFFAISTIVYIYNKKLGVIFYFSSILIVISRVFSGVHWPADILAGTLVGILSALLIHKLMVE